MSYKLLIAEDDRDLSLMYSMKFRKEWFDVQVAYDGLSTVAKLTEFLPDVLLLDIMMPSMDGFETLRVIRDLAPTSSTKIIVFSNLNGQHDIKRCMDLGADEYLLKADTTPKRAVERVLEIINASEIPLQNEHKENALEGKQCPYCGHALED